jgi:hypothetical protein
MFYNRWEELLLGIDEVKDRIVTRLWYDSFQNEFVILC